MSPTLICIIFPVVDGRKDTATVFEVLEKHRKRDSTILNLREFKKMEDDVLWLTYDVEN